MQFETSTTAEWLHRRCDPVVQLATVAAKCWQETEAIWIGSTAAINKLTSQDRSLTVDVGTTINPSDVVCDLGVLFDSELTMKKHTAKVAAVCFFHIRQLRRHVGFDNAAVGLLQLSVRGPAAVDTRAVTECRTPLLGSCLTHVIVIMSRHTWCNYTGCLSGHECSLNSAYWCTPFTTKDLCCISQTLYRLLRQQLFAAVFDHLPCTSAKFGKQAFAYAGPAAWNRLPDHIGRQSTPATFRRHLKTFLFAEVFNTTENFKVWTL